MPPAPTVGSNRDNLLDVGTFCVTPDRSGRGGLLFGGYGMKIGYIGLGNMGGALARRLQLSHPMMVHDRDKAAMQKLVGAETAACETAVELARNCDTIFLCLPTSKHVQEAIFGRDGLAESVNAGSIIVDQTTGEPTVTRSIAERLADKGVDFIDAPVSGGAQGAANGTIAVMVGAANTQFARIKPVLETLSPNIFHAGDVGAGHAIKLVNNLISGTQRLLTMEGVSLAAKNGIDPCTAVQILTAGGARNSYMEKVFGPRILEGDLDVGFTLELAFKDVRLATQLGTESGVPTFFGSLTRDLLQVCISDQGADAQVDTAAYVIERMSGAQMIVPKRDV